MSLLDTRAVGADTQRIEGPDKVTGAAVYAAETPGQSDLAWVWPVLSTIAKGRVREIDTDAVLGLPQILAVLTHENAPRLQRPDNAELAVLQDAAVAYRGQIVAAVVAESLEAAREAAEHLKVHYDEQPHDVHLGPDRTDLYTPDKVNPAFPTVTDDGDVEAGLAAAAFTVDAHYETPAQHNNPMEPHATLAAWHDGDLSVHDSNQGSFAAQQTLAALFDLAPERVHVTNPHVGGGFGSKGTIRPNCVLAAMAAQQLDRPVKIMLHRSHLFSLVGYRTPTMQHLRLGSDAEGRLTAIDHQVVEQTSTVMEFAEQTAVATRLMYETPNRRTGHKLARLDVPTPSWFRAPGECPGMFALESAMDELAVATGIDPIELRIRNEPPVEPMSGDPWSGRHLVDCLREGARRFGWSDRDPLPARRREGRDWVGTGVASGTYPAYAAPSTATVRAEPDGRFTVSIAATDLGTGARTALTQIAADALHVPLERVHVRIGDSAFGQAQLAGGSSGTASWGWAVTKACGELRDQLVGHPEVPSGGLEVTAETSAEIKARKGFAYHSFSAVFAEVRVDAVTGEVRVPRLMGVFSAGRIVNPRTARSQFLGGLTMGLSMALHEEGLVDPAFGDTLNHDLAEYHVAANADVVDIQAHWLDEVDENANPMGLKGIGEIGIVGTAAAVANAVHHAAGVRVRDLPIRLDKLIGRMPVG